MQERTQTNLQALVVKQWREIGFLNVCFCIGFPVADKEVRVCVAGHVSDLEEWLTNPLSLPPTDLEGIRGWADQVANYLGSNFPHAGDNSFFSEMITYSGKLWLPREPLYVQFEHKYIPEEHGIKYSIRITSEEEAKLFKERQEAGFTPAFAYLIESTCDTCKQGYKDCGCSKVLDANTRQTITRLEPLLLFWTNNRRLINLGPKPSANG